MACGKMVLTVGLEPRTEDLTRFATLRLDHSDTPPIYTPTPSEFLCCLEHAIYALPLVFSLCLLRSSFVGALYRPLWPFLDINHTKKSWKGTLNRLRQTWVLIEEDLPTQSYGLSSSRGTNLDAPRNCHKKMPSMLRRRNKIQKLNYLLNVCLSLISVKNDGSQIRSAKTTENQPCNLRLR